MKKIAGLVITLVIGGTLYSVSQADVAKNLSKDTGMTQQEAQQYVESVSKDDLESFDKVGSDSVALGQKLVAVSSEIDCVQSRYEWESPSLTCEEGKEQVKELGNSCIALGNAYMKLSSESASRDDISLVIRLIDRQNTAWNSRIVTKFIESSVINEVKTSNSYNKALLQTALDSK